MTPFFATLLAVAFFAGFVVRGILARLSEPTGAVDRPAKHSVRENGDGQGSVHGEAK